MKNLIKFIIGAVLGTIISIWLYALALCYLSDYIIYFLTPLMMMLGVIYVKFNFKYSYILSAVSLGSFLVIRGISLFLGGYPHDIAFYRQYKNIDMDIPMTIYFYICTEIALTLVMLFVQVLKYGKDDEVQEGIKSLLFGETSKLLEEKFDDGCIGPENI